MFFWGIAETLVGRQTTPLLRDYWLNGKSYWTNHGYDDISIQAWLGISYKDAHTEAAVLPYYSKRWYGGERYTHAPDLLNIKRSETDYQARLSLWSRKIHYWGITPRLTFSYRHTQSNHPGYTSSKFSTFIQLGKSF